MYTIKKIVNRSIFIPLTLLFVPAVANAQSIMIPGFMGIESSYMNAAASSPDTASAYFTISNLHYEPIVVLGVTGDMFDNASFVGANGDDLEEVIIQPGDRLVMSPNDVHFQLNDIHSSSLEEHSQDMTLLVRRGLEPLEEVEAQRKDANAGQRAREAGVPNEHKFIVSVPLGM